jgi:hypothetical protein
MQPAIDFKDLIDSLTDRFKFGTSKRVRMVGLVFATPNSPLSKAEIIPQLNDWHYRSGDHIDFYFAGYTYPRSPVDGYVEVMIPGGQSWLYSAERFDAFRKELESRTTWEYGGSCELLLMNAQFDADVQQGNLDFGSLVCCQLDAMKRDEAIQSIERFFEKVFRFAESAKGDDPTWGFSDKQGIGIAGSALKRVVLSLLPKGLDADYRKAEHFTVRDIGLA